ncbi:hypothetical protein niasHT_029887 [Heterodera trifolii]|uniref:Uncharacterized protein n=1 Tax=Heterodera trifolii TaxID=157864 RepID=A0ABD2KB43_9BILA
MVRRFRLVVVSHHRFSKECRPLCTARVSRERRAVQQQQKMYNRRRTIRFPFPTPRGRNPQNKCAFIHSPDENKCFSAWSVDLPPPLVAFAAFPPLLRPFVLPFLCWAVNVCFSRRSVNNGWSFANLCSLSSSSSAAYSSTQWADHSFHFCDAFNWPAILKSTPNHF